MANCPVRRRLHVLHSGLWYRQTWGVIRWQAHCGRRRKMIKREKKKMPPTQWPRDHTYLWLDPQKWLSSVLYLSTVKMYVICLTRLVGWRLSNDPLDGYLPPGFVTPHGNRDKVATLSSCRLFPSKAKFHVSFQQARQIHLPFRPLLMAFSPMAMDIT